MNRTNKKTQLEVVNLNDYGIIEVTDPFILDAISGGKGKPKTITKKVLCGDHCICPIIVPI